MPRQRKFKKIEPRFVRFENIGETVEGWVVNARDFQFRSGNPGVKYTLRDDNGQLLEFNAPAILRERLFTVGQGEYIRVTYSGDIDTGKDSPAKNFTVEVMDGMEEVPAEPTEPTDQELADIESGAPWDDDE